jgi:hypothetical protein
MDGPHVAAIDVPRDLDGLSVSGVFPRSAAVAFELRATVDR